MLKRLLIAMFAGPAALGVLAKLDERLDFTPFIERIILNFRAVADGFWTLISNKISFDLMPYGDLLSIVLLLFLPVVFQLMGVPFTKKPDLDKTALEPRSLEELEIIHKQEMRVSLERTFYYLGCFIFVNFVFHLFGYGGLVWILIIPGMILHYLLKDYRYSKSTEGADFKYLSYFGIVSNLVVLFVVFPFLLKTVLVENNPEIFDNVQWLSILIIGLSVSWVFYRASDYCCVAITNTALWVLGVLLINWTGNSFIPSLEQFLSSVNA